ncbi:TerB family tellurite resistance protein [Curvibacter sp. HBC61]|uniref:TerB family tellurite resistance protein n=1 Tax=Curvibacter cyanobacteriorum TaxID=3026422 RepID=A0ABT5MX28_9BURK|nr:TerB family tellurite resistance protein [Curvibacter sp. HBC61]MDD0838001.1 TerB family tellurite resistance protein [Curvibacter sp. HBC61]
MRTYPLNSPAAAARIIALTLIADRDLSPLELDCLAQQSVPEQLGLSPEALQGVLDGLCVDLQVHQLMRWEHACPVDWVTLQSLMDEISDPALRRRVLRLCTQLAEVDQHVAVGESLVLHAAQTCWGLPDQRWSALSA